MRFGNKHRTDELKVKRRVHTRRSTIVEDIRNLPVEQFVSGITQVAETARDADMELTLALTYAHRVMYPPLSLRFLSGACGLSPSTIRARVNAPEALSRLRQHLGNL